MPVLNDSQHIVRRYNKISSKQTIERNQDIGIQAFSENIVFSLIGSMDTVTKVIDKLGTAE